MAWTNIGRGTYSSGHADALTVVGKNLKKAGVDHRLAGPSLVTLTWENPTTLINSWAADAAVSGTNVIRMPIPPVIWSFGTSNTIEYFQNTIVPAVTLAISKGWYVILDWHPIENWSPTPSWTAEQEKFLKLVAHTYRNNPKVLIEPFNEPVSPSDFTQANWDAFKAYIQPKIDLIRKYCDNVIICPSPLWSSQTQYIVNNPVTGGNIMYCYHLYPNQHANAGGSGQLAGFLDGRDLDVLPIFMTEVGCGDGGTVEPDVVDLSLAPTFLTEIGAYLDANPHISYTAWALSADNSGIAMLGTTGASLKTWMNGRL